MSLFEKVNFTSHSGKQLDWKIECDALTDEDWECIAYIISKRFKFGRIRGIPNGGLKLASALEKYCDEIACKTVILIVDDVLTTGSSMEEVRNEEIKNIKGVRIIEGIVLFARGKCPDWITPIFQFNYET